MIESLTNGVLFVYCLIIMYGLATFKNLSLPFKYVVLLIIEILIAEFAADYLFKLNYNQSPLIHFNCIASTSIFFLIYKCILCDSKIWKLVKIIFGVGIISMLINVIFLQGLSRFPTVSINIYQLLVIISSGAVFLNMLEKPNSIPFNRDAIFWFNTATFIYFSTSYFIFTVPHLLLAYSINVNLTGLINIALCLAYYPILGFSIYLNSHRARYEATF